jgi:dTDP-4-dehydrorhamnose reductase
MRLWITGAAGMLGRRVVATAKKGGWQVMATTHLDVAIEDAGQVYGAMKFNPDAIINCAGRLPDSDPLEMVVANALGPHVLASVGVRLIHMSTDCVYSGRVGAGRGPDPIDLYGRTKLAGESDAPHVLNVRGSFIGPEGGFLRWLLGAQGEVDGWVHAYWNGSSVAVMAEKLVELAEGDRTGVVFAGSALWVTKAFLIEYFREALDMPITMRPTREPLLYRAFEPDIELPELNAALQDLVEEIKDSRVSA